MTGPTQKQNLQPAEFQLKDLLDLHTKDIKLNLNCHAVGTIQSFNPVNQTVSATINYKKTFLKRNSQSGLYDIILSDYPILLDCPALILSGGPCALTFPIAKGDECLIFFNDRDIDNWFAGSSTSEPATARLHSLSDGFALVGPRNQNRSLSGYDAARALLKDYVGGAKVGVGGEKVLVGNDDTTLNTILQNILTQLENLAQGLTVLTVTCATAGNPSSVPVNAATFTAIQTQLSTLATELGELLE